jgi:hypothetical protein
MGRCTLIGFNVIECPDQPNAVMVQARTADHRKRSFIGIGLQIEGKPPATWHHEPMVLATCDAHWQGWWLWANAVTRRDAIRACAGYDIMARDAMLRGSVCASATRH